MKSGPEDDADRGRGLVAAVAQNAARGSGGPVTNADGRTRGSLEGILACWFEWRRHRGEARCATAWVPFCSGGRRRGEAIGGGGSA
jgi:hypothetical protein